MTAHARHEVALSSAKAAIYAVYEKQRQRDPLSHATLDLSVVLVPWVRLRLSAHRGESAGTAVDGGAAHLFFGNQRGVQTCYMNT